MDFSLTDRERELQSRARGLADTHFRQRSAKWDETESYPWDNVKDLVAAGFMGMTIPVEYGGQGRGLLDLVIVVEAIARACGVTARIVVEGNVGALGMLGKYGTAEQKARYFPWVLRGEKPAIAITEPEAGSAASDMTTRADEVKDGYRLFGHKRYITGAGTSNLYLVYCRFGGTAGPKGIGAVWVEKGAEGFRIGRREPMMGLRGIPEGELHFEDCFVPRANLLVGPGDGFKKLMSGYNAQRLGAATVALGLAQGAFELAQAYALERRQFGRPISEFQGIRWKIADMAIKLDAARLLIYRAARTGTDFPDLHEAAIAKVFAAETAQQVTSEAVQILGAAGYGRSMPAERMMRDARMFTIGGGTAEMLRNLVADRFLPRPPADIVASNSSDKRTTGRREHAAALHATRA